ncbi:MAG: Hydroxymethylpyrimidine/phosphomethylpyrimidine kinase [Myxococcota bacterium]|nr:Hydroxymethylpyrimidine/phosphomethylpyrimidine kinase [Myxococcota bacterium]
MPPPSALTIAGSDPSGGAGVQADLKAFHAQGVFGMAAITSLTAQNGLGVTEVWDAAPDQLVRQVRAVLEWTRPGAIKTGLLRGAEVIGALAGVLEPHAETVPLVIDPIIRPTTGAAFLDDAGLDALRRDLVPLCALITPNLREAAWMTGRELHSAQDVLQAGRDIRAMGAGAVLIKSFPGEGKISDLLSWNGGTQWLDAGPDHAGEVHGTGCWLSALITARLALGDDLPMAVWKSREELLRKRREDVIRPGPGAGYFR